MAGQTYTYDVSDNRCPTMGVVVLGPDETLESDFRRLIPRQVDWYVSRLPSAPEVSSESLAAMEAHIGPAVRLFPQGRSFDTIGYACTSGASEIGPYRIAELIKVEVDTPCVTDPTSALVAACSKLGIARLGLVSPYVASVSEQLRQMLRTKGITTPTFGSFDVAEEATVARISAKSVMDAAYGVMDGADVDAVFLSCTNLRTLDVIRPLEKALGKPVLSSNQVLAWHMLSKVGVASEVTGVGRLFRK